MEDDDAVARLKLRNFAADLRDYTRGLVTVDTRRREEVVFDLFEIGRTDTAGFDADQNFSVADDGRFRPHRRR